MDEPRGARTRGEEKSSALFRHASPIALATAIRTLTTLSLPSSSIDGKKCSSNISREMLARMHASADETYTAR